MFTDWLGFRSERLVTAIVWGMIETEKVVSVSSEIVRLMPLMAMEPFSAMKRAWDVGSVKVNL